MPKFKDVKIGKFPEKSIPSNMREGYNFFWKSTIYIQRNILQVKFESKFLRIKSTRIWLIGKQKTNFNLKISNFHGPSISNNKQHVVIENQELLQPALSYHYYHWNKK